MTNRNAPAKASQEPLERQVEVLERLVRFSAELAAALRTEFAYYWLNPERQGQVPGAAEMVRRVDALRGMAGAYMRELRAAKLAPPMQALATYRKLDRQALFEATEGLEAMARTLREAGRQRQWGSHGLDLVTAAAASVRRVAPAPQAAPAPAAPATIAGRLKGWLEAFEAPKQAPTPTPPPPSIGARRLAAFEASLGLVVALRDDLAGPIAALQASLAPGGQAPGVPPALLPALPALAAELAANPGLHRAAEVAVTQYRQVAEALPPYQRALAAARGLPADKVGQALHGHDLAKLKGVMLPLTNLHATFRGFPATGALFPAPDVVRLQGAVPATEQVVSARREAPQPAEESPAPAALALPERPKFASWREEAEDLSKRRLSLLTGFMQDPDDRSVLKDFAMVYRVVADELAYQRERELDRRLQLRLILNGPEADDPAHAPRREALEKELNEARRMLAQLGQLHKYVAAKGPQ